MNNSEKLLKKKTNLFRSFSSVENRTVASHSSVTQNSIGIDYIVASLPLIVFAFVSYGARAVVVFALSVISQLLFDSWVSFMLRRKPRIELSSIVSGMLISLLLSPCVPYWVPVLIAFISSLVRFLQAFFSLSLFNPIIFGYSAVAAIFPKYVEIFAKPYTRLPASVFNIDAESEAVKGTVLAVESLKSDQIDAVRIFDILLGNRAGAIGELSAFLMICAALYLILRRVVTWHIPVAFVAVAGLVYIVFPQSPVSVEYMLYQFFDGMTMPIAVFFAAAYGASPVTYNGKLLFGASAGFLTALFRTLGGGYSCAAYATLIMNPFAIPFDRLTCPDAFGNIFLRAQSRKLKSEKRRKTVSALSKKNKNSDSTH